MTIRSILFTSDLSPASELAFEHARFLAEEFRARLTFYHAVALPPREYARFGAGHEAEVWSRVEAGVRRELERQAERLNVPFRIIVQHDVSAPSAFVDLAILELMRHQRPDLTIMASHGRAGVRSFFLGSVTSEVVRQASRPVLVVPPGERPPSLPYRRILVPTDLSPASRRPFPMAAVLARRFGATVLGLHVRPAPTLAALSGIPEPRPSPAPSEDELRTFLEADLKGLDLRVQAQEGRAAWRAIVDTAVSEEIELIVMSTHGHDSLSDTILGSQTERVLRHAPCPVLVA